MIWGAEGQRDEGQKDGCWGQICGGLILGDRPTSSQPNHLREKQPMAQNAQPCYSCNYSLWRGGGIASFRFVSERDIVTKDKVNLGKLIWQRISTYTVQVALSIKPTCLAIVTSRSGFESAMTVVSTTVAAMKVASMKVASMKVASMKVAAMTAMEGVWLLNIGLNLLGYPDLFPSGYPLFRFSSPQNRRTAVGRSLISQRSRSAIEWRLIPSSLALLSYVLLNLFWPTKFSELDLCLIRDRDVWWMTE